MSALSFPAQRTKDLSLVAQCGSRGVKGLGCGAALPGPPEVGVGEGKDQMEQGEGGRGLF